MLLLTSVTDLINLVTSAASNITVHASYVDISGVTVTPDRKNLAIITATTTAVVPSPAAATQRNVKALYVTNTSASVSCTVEAWHTDGTVAVKLMSFLLLPGESMTFDEGVGWRHRDATGSDYSPVIGAYTTVNGNIITQGSGTLTLADGKTLTAVKTLTFNGTDGTTLTFQGTDTYVGRATTDTLTNKTLTTPTINGASITGTVTGGANVSFGTGTFSGTTTVGGDAVSSPILRINGLGSTNNQLRWAAAGVDKLYLYQAATTYALTLDTAAVNAAFQVSQAGLVSCGFGLAVTGTTVTGSLQVTGNEVITTLGTSFEAFVATDIVYVNAVSRSGGAVYKALKIRASDINMDQCGLTVSGGLLSTGTQVGNVLSCSASSDAVVYWVLGNGQRTNYIAVESSTPGIITNANGGDLAIRAGGGISFRASESNGVYHARISATGLDVNGSVRATSGYRVTPTTTTDGSYSDVTNAGGETFWGMDSLSGTQMGFGAYYSGMYAPVALLMRCVSAGTLLTSGATAWASASDINLKTGLTPITTGLEKVNTLRAVTGRYLTDDTSVSRSFLIAQDVQAVLPEAVSENDKGELNLRYQEVIPLLVAAIKELNAKFEAYVAAHP